MIFKRSRTEIFWMVGLALILAALISLVLTAPASAQALSVDKTGPNTVEDGEDITYTIDVSSSGEVENVTLVDRVPEGTRFVPADSTNTCEENEEENEDIVRCGPFDLTDPENNTDFSRSFQLTFREIGNEITITNTAAARSANAENDNDSVRTTVGDNSDADDNGASGGQYEVDDEDNNSNSVGNEEEDNDADDDVINDSVPDKDLPETGGVPLLGVAFFVLASAGLLTAVVRRRR